MLVREATRLLPNTKEIDAWTKVPHTELPIFSGFRNSLAVDGWIVEDATLIPSAPIPIQDHRSRLRTNLANPEFSEALSRLDQYEAALDAGNWEAANGVGRGFMATLFVSICQVAEGATAPREESDARKTLEAIGFFAPSRQEKRSSPEAEFVFKMSSLMGTEGVHAGVSTPTTAAYRYAIALLTADYFIDRLNRHEI